MYTLYIDPSQSILKVSKAKKALQTLDFTDDVTRFNGNYMICLRKQPLIERAKAIRATWLSDLEDEIEKVKAIKF